MTSIHENLNQLRTTRNLTQAQLADELGVTRQTISSYESGRTTPDIETAKRLADILDVDVMLLLEGQSRHEQRLRRIRCFAILLLATLLLVILVHALLLWIANRFFLVPPGTPGDSSIVLNRMRWLDIWYASGIVLQLLAQLGCFILLFLTVSLRPVISLIHKVFWLAALFVGGTVVTLPWALTDHHYAPVNYFTAPVLALTTVLLSFIVSLVAEAIIRLIRTKQHAK